VVYYICDDWIKALIVLASTTDETIEKWHLRPPDAMPLLT